MVNLCYASSPSRQCEPRINLELVQVSTQDADELFGRAYELIIKRGAGIHPEQNDEDASSSDEGGEDYADRC